MKQIVCRLLGFTLIGLFHVILLSAQENNQSQWSISEIMRENFTGHSPENMQWAQDSQSLFFYWNPGDDKTTSPYKITPKNLSPEKVSSEEVAKSRPEGGVFSSDKRMKLEQTKNGLVLIQVKKEDSVTIFNSTQRLSNPRFSFDDSQVLFLIDNNLYSWSLETGAFTQLTNFLDKEEPPARSNKEADNEQDQWLKADQIELFPKLSPRKGGRDFSRYSGYGRFGRGTASGPKPIYLKGFSASNVDLSPDNRYVTYVLNKGPETSATGTKMPDYVTLSGYTEIRNTRSKVGNLPGEMKMNIFDLERDSVYALDLSLLPGIFDAPEYYAEYGREMKLKEPKTVYVSPPEWSADGKFGVMTARSFDNKDRWIFLVDLASGKPIVLDHQHDAAWIAGPGIGYRGSMGWMPDQKRVWFQSEVSGYSHLYTVDVETKQKKALTSGDFEVYRPFLSNNKKYWYFTSNEVHPGERHFYRMPLDGGERTQITSMAGDNQVKLSPDEKYLAITYSFANRPPELYFQPNKAGTDAIQITDGRSKEYKSYNWRVPEFVTFTAEDGAKVHARLYTPAEGTENKAAVIFVHGAGYLQNAHKWWSTYYHEYLFHNILADNGYTILDVDYRGSSGYGRDWRTGIYRWMGGKDLSDHVDGAKYLMSEHQIDPDKIGIYGGSYGGFITLMAMFNAPDIFAAGAALRSVTDWAHYNHGYTANILNTPVEDSIAYAKSSPIYFAEGLTGHLLMCHGMLDDNVHFQDIVRLSQRLIDLGKDDWELAVYPLQRHSFTDPDAWTDEYKRIFKLFQNTIGQK